MEESKRKNDGILRQGTGYHWLIWQELPDCAGFSANGKRNGDSMEQNDFSMGSVPRTILRLALPMTLAQLINVLYNIVDRIYIGHLPEASTTALGLTFPIITIISAFANLFGMGGAPLCSIARGRGDIKRAEEIMGNSFALLIMAGAALTALCLLCKEPILYLFGASADTFPYADQYVTIYVCGSVFVMVSLGMNSFINAQGFAKMGMLTILIGAVLNILLDPLFIFVLGMGVRGAALATVLSQMVSACWVLRFLTGKRAIFRLKREAMRLRFRTVKEITALGLSGFIMSVTNGLVQIVCNATLQRWGGDIYVGVMTVLNSVREVLTLPVMGLTNGAQPFLGFNYGAGQYQRVRKGMIFMSFVCIGYTVAAWVAIMLAPDLFIHLFNSEPELLAKGVPALNLYFFGFFFMSFQFSCQSTFVALGKSKQAIFFSLFRKAIIVVPLTIWLPGMFGLGVNGVFVAEPISNFIGGISCFATMMLTVWPALKKIPARGDGLERREIRR